MNLQEKKGKKRMNKLYLDFEKYTKRSYLYQTLFPQGFSLKCDEESEEEEGFEGA